MIMYKISILLHINHSLGFLPPLKKEEIPKEEHREITPKLKENKKNKTNLSSFLRESIIF